MIMKTIKRIKWGYSLTLSVLGLFLVALSAPKLNAKVIVNDPPVKTDTTVQFKGISTIETDGEKQPIYVYDGVRISTEELNNVNPDNIASVNVLKGESGVAMYGKDAVNGVIIIDSKDPKPELDKNRLIIIDGEIMPQGFDINTISPSDIDSLTVLNGETAIEKYGEKGRNGATIIIKMK